MLAPAETIPTVCEIERLLASNGELVGASTGYMVGARGDWPRLVAAAAALSGEVAELSALDIGELPGLIAFLADRPELPFRHLSIHGPSKGWHGSGRALAVELAALPATVEGIVMHPETFGEVAPFAALGSRLRLENMDTRKADARTAEELAPYFDRLPAARFCLDIAHAKLHDPSMAVAHDLLDAFGDRLAEVHLSSIADDGRHLPLTPDDAVRFAPVLKRCLGVPWVLEAPLAPRHGLS